MEVCDKERDLKNSINHEELKNCLHFHAEEKIGGLANKRNHT